MPRPSPRLASLCGLLDAQDGASWQGPEADLVALARRHRVEPLLYVRLAEATTGWRPEKTTLDVLARDYRSNTERVLRSIAWLQRLTETLAAEGIEARPLKGLPLADQAYGRIADRHCGDLDLLIGSHRLRERADRAARASGLRPKLDATGAALRLDHMFHKEDCYVSPDGLGVEVHYHRDGIGQHIFPEFLAFGSAAWHTCQVGSTATRRLFGEALLLYLLSHGTRCAWHRLKWLLDVRRLTRHYDAQAWIELQDAARRINLELDVHAGLQLLKDAFNVPSLCSLQPRSNVGRPRVGFVLRRCWLSLNRESESPDTFREVWQKTRYNFVVRRNWRARLAMIGEAFIRVPDIAHSGLPMPLLLVLAPIARPFSLVYRRALQPIVRKLFN
jgi:hypothetical protein